MSEYDLQAHSIADEIDLTVKITPAKEYKAPPWRTPGEPTGNRYRVTLKIGCRLSRHGPERWATKHGPFSTLTFDYWGSINDKENGIEPTWYDVLSCVASDASMPTDPDEVVAELGEMKPSQAIRAAKFAQRLQNFFTEAELTKLSEIQ